MCKISIFVAFHFPIFLTANKNFLLNFSYFGIFQKLNNSEKLKKVSEMMNQSLAFITNEG